MAAENTSPDIEAALAAARERDDQAGFLRIFAVSKVVLPQMRPLNQTQGIELPFIEQDGTRYVLAFSSQQRLADSGVDAQETITLTGGDLGESWPDDQELWLVINQGSEPNVALPPNVMRAVPSLVPDR